MANIQKGEIPLTMGGVSYTLTLNLGAMIAAETALSTPDHPVSWGDIQKCVERGHLRHIRALFWAMLRKHHPNISLDAAGELIEQFGGEVSGAMFATQAAAAPDPVDAKAVESAGPRPRKARAVNGTGANSTAPPDASV
jgi:hypothetical protein